MARSFWLIVGISVVAAGCGGETFSATEGDGGSPTTTADGGKGGSGAATAAGGTGGSTSSSGGMGGAGATGGGGGQGGTGGFTCQPLSEPCTECAFDSCQDLYCACYASNDCPALINCISVCDPNDDDCVKPCLTAHEMSISTAFLLGDCASAPCSDVCVGVTTQQACPKCLFEKCSTQMNTCLADPDCYDIVMCAVACPPNDLACAFGCAQGKPQESTQKALAVQQCTTDANICQAECGG